MEQAPDLTSQRGGIGGGGGVLLRACGTTWCGSEATAGSLVGIGTALNLTSRWCGIGGGGGCALVQGRMPAGKIERKTEGRPVE
jgi:hypothetical protein